MRAGAGGTRAAGDGAAVCEDAGAGAEGAGAEGDVALFIKVCAVEDCFEFAKLELEEIFV